MPQRLLTVVVPVCAAGLAIAVAAAISFVSTPHDAITLLGVGALLAASTVANRFPVPVEGIDAGGVSLSFVFGTSATVLYGWDAGVLVAIGAPAIMQLLQRRPGVRVAYNASAFAIAAGAAGVLVGLVDGVGTADVVAQVVLSASAQYAVNLTLITTAVALSQRRPPLNSIATSVRATLLIFALMASAAVMLVTLWQRSPFLSIALVGPLLAIALYQRSTHRALRAMRLALTDPLTGLGNHRNFQERVQREIVLAADRGVPFTLCLIDVDDFKRVNDLLGHPTGDSVLAQLGRQLRQNGEAFRLGGDEFALLLPEQDANDGLAAGDAIVRRIASLQLDQIGSVNVSAGIATFPDQAGDRDELIRLADSALYWAKEHGKNRVHVYRPDVVELAELRGLAHGPDRAARYRAAASLAKAVDLRDAYTGRHSNRVGDLAALVAQRLEMAEEFVELTRLAGSLHDLGKLAVPEEILRKPALLTRAERRTMEEHPRIGYRMLESLDVGPLADWVLHHHEWWDGGGYPDGLLGEQIPLGARIILVADAFDAMTSDRVYRARLTAHEALDELERCAGTQFDPQVVSALTAELALDSAAAAA